MQKLNAKSLDAMLNDQKVSNEDYIKVGMSACGLAAGADEVYQILKEEIEKRKLPVKLTKCGCFGMCFAEPLVEVKTAELPAMMYGRVNKDVALKILDRHVVGKIPVNDSIFQVKPQ